MILIIILLLLIPQFPQSAYASGSGDKGSLNSIENNQVLNEEQPAMKEVYWSESNRLADTGSPYLEQHVNNPVHWIPWGDKAFEEARRRDIPILVSIGYSSCHWCHVMAHECFEKEDVAALMNESQINIKVDREQHPGVDAVYMEAAQALTGSGGWPLNVFVDHEGRPFLAVTYLPPDRWSELITQVNKAWREDRGRIDEIAAALSSQLNERKFPGDTDSSTLPTALMQASRDTYDGANPGFAMGSRPMKFPPSQTIDWLLEYSGEEGEQMAVNILRAMMDSGLYDRVGGGFHRYSTDAVWRVPHFEKMTYDNAQLMGLYARGSVFDADLLSAARSTADWFLDEMRLESEDGGFLGYATATDADDPLGEGTYFAWPPGELEKVLGLEDAAWLAERWNLSGEGLLPTAAGDSEYEPVTSWIPHPRGAPGYPETYRSQNSADSQRETALIVKLKIARQSRPAPARDDKVLTDQNALLLEGFSRLARYGGGEKYREAAVELADFLIKRSSPHLIRDSGIDAYITDYGYLAMALTQIYSLTGNPLYVEEAEKTTREAIERLAVGDGSYFSTAAEDGGLYKRAIEEFDGPSPAGQHALGIAFARLYEITGRTEWKEMADSLLAARAYLGSVAPSSTATLVRLASMRNEPYTLVVAGPGGYQKTKELLEETRRLTSPDLMVVAADRAAEVGIEDWAELGGRIGMEKPQLLVCREGSCLLPAFTVEEVKERLMGIGEGR